MPWMVISLTSATASIASSTTRAILLRLRRLALAVPGRRCRRPRTDAGLRAGRAGRSADWVLTARRWPCPFGPVRGRGPVGVPGIGAGFPARPLGRRRSPVPAALAVDRDPAALAVPVGSPAEPDLIAALPGPVRRPEPLRRLPPGPGPGWPLLRPRQDRQAEPLPQRQPPVPAVPPVPPVSPVPVLLSQRVSPPRQERVSPQESLQRAVVVRAPPR